MKTEIIAVISAVVIVLIAIGIVKYQELKIGRLSAELTRLNIELAQTGKELTAANSKITAQNEVISAMAIDFEIAKAEYGRELEAARNEYAKQKAAIQMELIRDPSCENELRLVNEQLLVFMGGL